MSRMLIKLVFIQLFLVQVGYTQNIAKWQDDLLKIYNGTLVYSAKDFIQMYESLDKTNVVARSIWGLLVVQSAFVNAEETSELPQIQTFLVEIFNANRKLSPIKSSSEELYYAGRFAFYLLGYSTFYKLQGASFYDSYMEFRSLLVDVVQRKKEYQNEARVFLSDGLSHPANKTTNSWNSYIIKTSQPDIFFGLPKDLQYRLLIAKARILIKKDRIIEAKQYIQQAKDIFPKGGAEATILELSLES